MTPAGPAIVAVRASFVLAVILTIQLGIVPGSRSLACTAT